MLAFKGSKGLSAARRKVLTGAEEKMGLPWDAYYVLTKAEARLANSKIHPTAGAPDYDIRHDHKLDFTNVGTNTHAQIDTHIALTTNPHSADTRYLKLDGSNANANINIGAYSLTTTGTGTFGQANSDSYKSLDGSSGGIDWNGDTWEFTGEIDVFEVKTSSLAYSGDQNYALTLSDTTWFLNAGFQANSFTDGTASWTGSNLSGFDTIQANDSVTAGTLTIAAGSITDTTGAIDFGDENLETTGTGTFNTLVGGAGGLTLGQDKTAPTVNAPGFLKLWSAGNNAYYSTFTAATQTANETYTLPTAMATANSQALLCSTAGVLSWGTNFGANNIATTGTISDGVLTISDGSIIEGNNATFNGEVEADVLRVGSDFYVNTAYIGDFFIGGNAMYTAADDFDIFTGPGKVVHLQYSATGDVALFGGATSGKTRTLSISGFRTGDALRTMVIGVGTAAANQADITGLALYKFTGSIQASGYNSSDGSAGATGSFTSADGKTVTVKNGLITSIV